MRSAKPSMTRGEDRGWVKGSVAALAVSATLVGWALIARGTEVPPVQREQMAFLAPPTASESVGQVPPAESLNLPPIPGLPAGRPRPIARTRSSR